MEAWIFPPYDIKGKIKYNMGSRHPYTIPSKRYKFTRQRNMKIGK
jgi:hypothetical protein